jgi:hypothetical protein
LTVRHCGRLTVAFAHCAQRHGAPSRRPSPSALSQPMVVPEVNQKHAWPTSHASVPLEQLQPSWHDHGRVEPVA